MADILLADPATIRLASQVSRPRRPLRKYVAPGAPRRRKLRPGEKTDAEWDAIFREKFEDLAYYTQVPTLQCALGKPDLAAGMRPQSVEAQAE